MTPLSRQTQCEGLRTHNAGRRTARAIQRARRVRRLAAGAVLCAGLLVGGLGVATVANAFPANVILLSGETSRGLDASFTYGVKQGTINGFAISYTCRGKEAINDSDVYEIADGGDDDVPLAWPNAGGSVSFTLRGSVTRQSEDGPIAKGLGTLVVHATLTKSGRKRILRGTARVRFASCPSVTTTFAASGATR